MDEKTQKEKMRKIEEICKEYEEKLAELRKEQNEILDEFLADCEKSKMEELRNKLE